MSDRKPPDLLDWLAIRRVPDWARAPWLGGFVSMVLVLVLLLAFAAAIWLVLGVFRGTGGGPMGGLGAGALVVAILGAPFLIWNTWIRHRTLGFQKEGHITDRIAKAVELLGADKTEKSYHMREGVPEQVERTVPNIEVRIGGLWLLERIAKDSTAYDGGRDHVRVMEILCAYIRENAKARAVEEHGLGEWEPLDEDATEEERAEHRRLGLDRLGFRALYGNPLDWASLLKPPREDVQLALTILGRRTAEQHRVEARWGPKAAAGAEWVFDTPCPELPDAAGDAARDARDLAGFVDLLRDWKRVIGGYPGYRPDLRGTNLQKADLSGLVLCGARLNDARLEGAKAKGARLTGADLTGARLEGADFSGTSLEGANLSDARLEGVRFSAARLVGADFLRARLEGADLSWATMSAADLYASRLDWANLSSVQLEGAVLSGTRLDEAVLESADLRGAALLALDCSSATGLSAEQVNAAFGDESVILPHGITAGDPGWPAHWPVSALLIGGKMSDALFMDAWRQWLADPVGWRPPPPPGPPPPA